MADRIHPYPMFPQNITPNTLPQSQIPQQPPQSQQPDPQMLSMLSNPEHSRMWQQMNSLQNPYRSQQSGDLATSQMNHQMQEFARGQALSHGQGQPIVQQIQQSFALNAQRMNQGGPVFHDPQPNQPQSFIPSNFPNMPMNTQQQMKPALHMNPMMHATMNNAGVNRQLKMLSQQEMARLQQSGLGAQHAPGQSTAVDMFAPQSMQPSQEQIHGSPHPVAQPIGPPGANQQMVPGNTQQNPQKRMMTMTEFQERRSYLHALIAQSENNLQAVLQSVRNGAPMDPGMQQKLAQLRTELNNRKEMHAKFLATYGAIVTQQLANGMPQGNVPHMSPMPHPASQPPQQPSVSTSQVQPGFVTQGNQPVAAQYNVSASNGASPLPTPNQGVLNQQIPIQSTQPVRPNTIPPRTGGTPHQIPGQLPNTSSPNLANFAGQGGQKVPNPNRQSVGVMPLDKQRFDSTYTQFCRSQNINPGLRVAIGEGRNVDLHQLHVYVMHEGGAQSVTQRDMWAVIGGRLGFIQFPGNDSEPARSGPGIAQQLQNTYEQYLHHFEHAYILTVKNRSAMGSQQQTTLPSPLVGNNATPGIPGGSSEMPLPPNASRQVPNQQFVAAVARYSRNTADEMRAQRIPEHLIAFVERNRAELLKVYQQQLQMIAKRNAEQEQQNLANTQGQMPNMHEQASIALQSGVQRPPPNVGMNGMANMPPGDSKMVNGSFAVENVPPAPQKLLPPTQEQVQNAMQTINQLKNVFQQRLGGMATQQIPDDQRVEYAHLLELVSKMTTDLDAKLHMYFVVFKSEELLRKYVAIVLTVGRQWQLANSPTPQYIISLSTLKTVQGQIQKLNEEFENRYRAMRSAAAANSQHLVSLTSGRLNHGATLTVPPSINPPQITSTTSGRQVSVAQQQSQQPQPHIPTAHSNQQPSHPNQHQSQIQSHPPPQPPSQSIRKSFPPSPSNPPPPSTIASPTPPPAVASSSTPATSAPTPQTVCTSPRTPKSPPAKATARTTKVATRATRKPSTAGKAPATPETTPSVVGVKRPPEDDVTTLTSVAPSEAEASNAPSPKKAKTEWEGEPSEALVKRKQEVENIRSAEDAAAFFDHMKALFDMSAPTDNDISHDIASTLDQILAGVAQEPADAAATAAALSMHGAGDAGPPPTALSPHMGPANDAFLEFIDFSSFTTLDDEDNNSKAPTPDLVPSSETNLSPESGSEGDLSGNTGSPDKAKIEESGDRSDPLRLGSLREIDGGESAYYQVDNWKWEGSMPTLDQPWAIFTS
ncbi:hypothetical protein JVU11DRAFT_4201 [Chiua virens]|nr:hypothetical protein JVU11DRAFT_4201 [Chiua virens]